MKIVEGMFRVITVVEHPDAKRLNVDLFWGRGDGDQPLFRESVAEVASGQDGHHNEIGRYAEQPM